MWTALPGPSWPVEVAAAVQACAASGRGAVVVVPDARDLDRVSAALHDVPHAALSAELGPAERYRRWLSVLRGTVRVAVGTRATAFAPVRTSAWSSSGTTATTCTPSPARRTRTCAMSWSCART